MAQNPCKSWEKNRPFPQLVSWSRISECINKGRPPCIHSGQIAIIFHCTSEFPKKKSRGFFPSTSKLPLTFGGSQKSCDFAMIWPEWCVELGLTYPKLLEVQCQWTQQMEWHQIDMYRPNMLAMNSKRPKKWSKKSPWMKMMMFWSNTCFTSLGPNHDPKFHQAIIGERLGFQWPTRIIAFLGSGIPT